MKTGCLLVASAFLASCAVAQAPDQSQSDIVAMPQMQAMHEQMARIHATAEQQMMGQRMGIMQQMMEQMVERMTQGQTPELPGGTSERESHQEHH